MIKINIKKLLLLTITLFISFTSIAQSDSLYKGIPVKYFSKVVTDTEDSVIIRSVPDQSSQIVSVLPNNYLLTIINVSDKHEIIAKADGQWIKISFNDSNGVYKEGYIFDFFTKAETEWIKVKYVNYSCGDYCYFDFESDGYAFSIGGGYCNNDVAAKYPLSNYEGDANPEMLNRFFYIKIGSNKVKDVMATELISEKIEFSRFLLICDIKAIE